MSSKPSKEKDSMELPEEKCSGQEMAQTLELIAEACDEFSEITTFHGLRLVCARNLHVFRRSIWIIIVLSCFVALALQVQQQVIYFLSHPKTIYVEKMPVKSLDFPAITICNENTFKISAAYQRGYFNVIKKMIEGNLSQDDVDLAEVGNLSLDELHYQVGNRMETMLLRCKWSTNEKCSATNFTTQLTDQGLCHTFNGPLSDRSLTVQTPGASKALQLTLNVEEYERMSGSHVASGIHLLVHHRREYPLVERLGQAVATGSHTFIALSEIKEQRLGRPYANCSSGHLSYVPNDTYIYARSSCETECYVAYVVAKCGCKDFYMPGDVRVCNLNQYVQCLKTIQQHYTSREDKFCDCSTPCSTVRYEPLYSYGALSKIAVDKLKQEDIEKIKPRYKKALDVSEYLSESREMKKKDYSTFSRSLHLTSDFYRNIPLISTSSIRETVRKMSERSALFYHLIDGLLLSQVSLLMTSLIGPWALERQLADVSPDCLAYSLRGKFQQLKFRSNDDVNRLMLSLIIEQLDGRQFLTRENIIINENVLQAYKSDISISWAHIPGTYNFSAHIPATLSSSVNSSVEITQMFAVSDVSRSWSMYQEKAFCLQHQLELVRKMSLEFFQSENYFVDQQIPIRETIDQLIDHCKSYQAAGQTFQRVMESPVSILANHRKRLNDSVTSCLRQLNSINPILDLIEKHAREILAKPLNLFTKVDGMLGQYHDNLKISKFDIVDLLLGKLGQLALAQFNAGSLEILDSISKIKHFLSQTEACFSSVYNNAALTWRGFQDNLQDSGVNLDPNLHPNLDPNLDQLTLDNADDMSKIHGRLSELGQVDLYHQNLTAFVQLLMADAKNFRQQAVVDLNFYSKNFIFLDIYFSDISYISTEQQVAYDVIKLLSDIGGSMGLLVGASAISLSEFFDFICLLVTHLRRKGLQHVRRSSGMIKIFWSG